MEATNNAIQKAVGWIVKDLERYGNRVCVVEHSATLTRITFCTAAHMYRIRITANYMGCIATCRIARAGEDWLRGNDLPDGPLTLETWAAIKNAVLSYELVELSIRKGAFEIPPGAPHAPSIPSYNPVAWGLL